MQYSFVSSIIRTRSNRLHFVAMILLLIGFIILTLNTIWNIWDVLSSFRDWPVDYWDFAARSVLTYVGTFLIFAAIFFFSLMVMNMRERSRMMREHRESLSGNSGGYTDLSEVVNRYDIELDWKAKGTLLALTLGFLFLILVNIWSYWDVIGQIDIESVEAHLRLWLMILERVFYFSGISIVAYLIIKGR